jgi:hypothetical protein
LVLKQALGKTGRKSGFSTKFKAAVPKLIVIVGKGLDKAVIKSDAEVN